MLSSITFHTRLLPLLLILTCFSVSIVRAETIPSAPKVPVRGYVLMDYESGKLLASLKGDERLEPASITKIMTTYVVSQALKSGKIQLSDMVTISRKARHAEGSRMFIEAGSLVSVEDLMMGMVVQSGNDASIALAEHVAGSEGTFAELMNQAAAQLGLTNSHFVNATGLPDPNHHMSAHDIAILTQALIRDFPDIYAHYAVRSFKYNKIEQQNRNRLLWRDPSVDGVKTGHTQSAGFCLVTSAKRDDTRLISVVLGADRERDRFSASQELLNYGFSFYESRKLYDANTPITQTRIWKGQENELSLGVAEALYVTVPKGQASKVSTTTTVQQDIIAPAQKGQPFGEIVVKLGDREVSKTPLVALNEVPESGWFGWMIDSILLFFHALFG